MTLESIDKLREFVDDQFVISGQAYLQGMAIANSIEAEIAESYMLLPVDADGVPIKPGDEIEYGNGTRDKVRFIVINEGEPTFNERGWCPNHCRHVKPDRVKELLEEFAAAIKIRDGFNDATNDAIDEYAAKLREAVNAE